MLPLNTTSAKPPLRIELSRPDYETGLLCQKWRQGGALSLAELRAAIHSDATGFEPATSPRADRGARTLDLILTKDVRYQLRHISGVTMLGFEPRTLRASTESSTSELHRHTPGSHRIGLTSRPVLRVRRVVYAVRKSPRHTAGMHKPDTRLELVNRSLQGSRAPCATGDSNSPGPRSQTLRGKSPLLCQLS